MDQKKFEIALNDLNLGHLLYLESTTSTNEIATKWVGEGVSNYSLIAANEQTHGRGRVGRKWITNPGTSLAFSLIIHPKIGPDYISRYTGLGALAVSDAIINMGIEGVKIKFPNDVLIHNQKVCGILTEAIWHGNDLKAIILGIGINLTKDSLPGDSVLNFPATYLEAHTSTPVDRLNLLHEVLVCTLQREKTIDTTNFISAWNNRLAFLGQKVSITLLNTLKNSNKKEPEIIEGIHKGINQDGEMQIELVDGKIICYPANEIQILR